MYRTYEAKNFRADSLEIIKQANDIIVEYISAGYKLTLRQLYYQFVSRDLIKNTEREYSRLGRIISEARLGGLIRWDAIVDRTRELTSKSHFNSPQEIVEAAAQQYHIDWWVGQKYRVEVWIEKEALVGVIEGICEKYDVPYFACRGYVSQSEMWNAAQRIVRYMDTDRRNKKAGQEVVILYLGDHDPSGLDMTRDIQTRLKTFASRDFDFERLTVSRIALHMWQVEQHSLPPNPAKVTDSRFEGYQKEFGEESWELDALSPKVIVGTIEGELLKYLNKPFFKARKVREEKEKAFLLALSDKMEE